jgi:general secretion pathway protein C
MSFVYLDVVYPVQPAGIQAMLRIHFTHRFMSMPFFGTVAAIAMFVAALAWWAHVFTAPAPAALAQPAPTAALDTAAGATLFGSQPDQGPRDTVQLLGILSFDPQHGAAIVSIGGDPPRVIRVNGKLNDSTTLSEVRAHSIIVKRGSLQREITLQAVDNPSAFVR